MVRRIPLRRAALSAAVLTLFGASAAHAYIITSADFDSPTYTNGPLVGQDGWVAHSGAGTNAQTVANTATNGNVTLTTSGEDTHRNAVLADVITSGSAFLSADFTVNSAQATGDYFIHLGDGGGSNFYDRVYVKSVSGGFVMALATSSGTPTYGTMVLTLGTAYHMVAEYDFVTGLANDTASLYINPTDPLYGGDNLYVAGTTTGTDASLILGIYLRQGSASAAPGVTVDNVALAKIPEPASLSLLALGAAGLLVGKRRMK